MKQAVINRGKQLATGILVLVLAFSSVLFVNIGSVSAAQIVDRTLAIDKSAPSETGVQYAFSFDVPSSTVLQSWEAEMCTTASGACTTPTGWTGASANLASQPTNLGDASGWTDESTASALRLKKTGNSAAPTGTQIVAFSGVTNPSTANQTFFARITTYSDDAYSTAVDTGVAATSTATAIELTGVVDETLVFCAGTSITGTNCGTISGSTVDFGTFSSTAASTGTSVMAASTNGQGGYTIAVDGATLTSGANTITALASQTASSPGSEQFGMNLRDNASPNVGADVSGSGSGSVTSNYNTADQFIFEGPSFPSIASAAGATDANTYTVSYLVNIGGATEAGTYTTTLNYIATATF